MANPAATAYLSFRDRELSNDVQLVQVRWRKVVVHTFLGCPKPGWWDRLRAGIIESHNFFVLCPILVKLHIRTRLIESFPTTYGSQRCTEEKLRFTPVHALRQLECDERVFPPLRRVVEFRARYRQTSGRRFFLGGRQNLETVPPTIYELLAFAHTHTRIHAHKAINIIV